MPKRSAGILFYEPTEDGLKVLLAHPGGPLWQNKHEGAWQLPKGEIEAGEDDETAARREVQEELGVTVEVPLIPLGEVRQAGGKRVVAFAAKMRFDVATVVSNEIEIEWPSRSGHRILIPEIDQVRWLDLDEARRLMLPSQLPFLSRLQAYVEEPRSADMRSRGGNPAAPDKRKV